ncbi:hypothetical protein [Pseudonocardia sp. WMMC193]|uniref:hypothetical protein n=1 Tax=Pseudonocardia sp. WMMC193 TaxID=2911965 RepID=UPI001F2152BA|nr:hypothetical protein [Pseudonocardia sp. WMMC193]MCF7548165.1 hypothetical protein [Pseudonocardia sp. WMMC193]
MPATISEKINAAKTNLHAYNKRRELIRSRMDELEKLRLPEKPINVDDMLEELPNITELVAARVNNERVDTLLSTLHHALSHSDGDRHDAQAADAENILEVLRSEVAGLFDRISTINLRGATDAQSAIDIGAVKEWGGFSNCVSALGTIVSEYVSIATEHHSTWVTENDRPTRKVLMVSSEILKHLLPQVGHQLPSQVPYDIGKDDNPVVNARYVLWLRGLSEDRTEVLRSLPHPSLLGQQTYVPRVKTPMTIDAGFKGFK